MNYDIAEHRHRFSAWAAARAAQRGFTTVENLYKALENCGLREFLSTSDVKSVKESTFDLRHRSWCQAIMSWLQRAGVEKVTFGRAAKLIAVYLKSMVVLGGHSEDALGKVAHPPIDRILLANLAKSNHVHRWATVSWTNLDETAYYELIGELRAIEPGKPFWMLERYWPMADESEP